MSEPTPVVAPVQLGCCRESPRCLSCPPPPPLPDREWISALLHHYTDRGGEGELRVAFHGGPPPSDALLDALDGVPFTVRVRPDLLTREIAGNLARRGVRRIELDALTLNDHALRQAGRRYPGGRVLQILDALPGLGVEGGVVLAPGLPGTTHDSAVADAVAITEPRPRTRGVGATSASGARIPLAATARIHPVLVLEDSRLQALHVEGTYVPLTLGQAVTTCRAMMDVLEDAGVSVIRVGVQPGPDELGRALAGPRHPSIRELVEALRFKDRLRGLLDRSPAGADVVVRCAAADETRTRGPLNQNLRDLRVELGLGSLKVAPDPRLERGALLVETSIPGNAIPGSVA